MPNVSPRGVFVRATPGTNAPMSDGWVYDGATYRPVERVYGWNGSAWVVLWAAGAASPTGVTVTWATSQVTVSWALPSPEVADSYAIRRPDGSLAGSVGAGIAAFVDVNPLPLNGAYTVHGVLAGVEAAGASSPVLDLRLPPTGLAATVNNAGTAAATVTLGWGFTAGRQPDQWTVRRNGAVVASLAGASTTWTDAGPLLGEVATYSVTPVLSTVESSSAGSVVVSVPAAPPTGVTLTAMNPPIATLRLAWVSPAGSRTGFEVERNSGAGWVAHTNTHTLSSDWSTSVAGWMRVRTTSAGGVSAWVQAGPVTPITDVTPPGEASVLSFVPEATYGRMVLRANLPGDSDLSAYRVVSSWDAGVSNETIVSDWSACSPGQYIAVVTAYGSGGQTAWARVDVRDAVGNVRVGAWVSYVLAASPIQISAIDSGTSRNGVWRNDASVDADDIQTGGTSVGQNIGCMFFGSQIPALVGWRTVTGMLLYLERRDHNGNSSGISPLWWTHSLPSKAGTPALADQGVDEASRLSAPMVRYGGASTWWLPAAFVAALKAGSATGLAAYRPGGSGSPDQFYMGIWQPGVNSSCVLEIHHLG